eukprot:8304924-Karenia_brevis.AAC.1
MVTTSLCGIEKNVFQKAMNNFKYLMKQPVDPHNFPKGNAFTTIKSFSGRALKARQILAGRAC